MKSGFNYSFHRSPVNTLWAPDSRTTQGCPWTSMCSSRVARPRPLYLASTRRWTSQDSCRWEQPLRPVCAHSLSHHSHAWKRCTAWASPHPRQEARPGAQMQHRCSWREIQRHSQAAWAWKQGLWMKHSGTLGCKGIPLSARAKLKLFHHGYQTNYALSNLFDVDPLHIWG